MLERRSGFLVITVTQRVRYVPQQPSAFCSLHSTAFELLPELFIGQIEKVGDVTVRGYVTWLKGLFGSRNTASIGKWADLLGNLLPEDYAGFLSTIKSRIRAAQYAALKAANTELIALYWDLGKLIVERQQGDSWGKAVVQTLAKDLQTEFPGMQGFSAQNLWRMRDFYSTYHANAKLSPLVREIGWTHNTIILAQCKDDLEREYYIRMTSKFGWTKNVLIHHIENQTYEKTLLNQTNFDQTVSDEIRNQAKLAVRSEYLFDFLDLGDTFNERQFEAAILTRVEPFLKQMGGMFTFIGSQYRLEIDDNEYWVDLLLYHRWLKCLVALELKIDEFKPEYVGKMQFYLAVLDDTVRLPDENPSIGIILCKSQKRTVVEYALRESNKPIGVATYRMVSELPQEYRNKLPAPEQVATLLQDITEPTPPQSEV